MSLLESELKPDCSGYRDLSVNVIAEPVEAVRLDVKLPVLQRLLADTRLVPVLEGKKRLFGVVSGTDLLLSLELQAPTPKFSGIKPWVEVIPPLKNTDTIERAIHFFEQGDCRLIPIVDANGCYTGRCASRILLQRLLHGMLKPPRVGGLATPLGVYLTSGYHMAGSGWKGLLATGVLFGLLVHGLDWLTLTLYGVLLELVPVIRQWAEGQQMVAHMGITLVCLLGLLRLSPMSGLHAAEHMTINAIENDLPLTEPAIRTQPREHARCGTNLMVFLGGVELLGLFLYYSWERMNPLGLMLFLCFWAFVIGRFWQPAGLWLQRHFTTKDPTSAQLASGIKAGNELLAKFQKHPHAMPGLTRRLWGSGLFHMLAAFLLTAWVVGLALEWLKLN